MCHWSTFGLLGMYVPMQVRCEAVAKLSINNSVSIKSGRFGFKYITAMCVGEGIFVKKDWMLRGKKPIPNWTETRCRWNNAVIFKLPEPVAQISYSSPVLTGNVTHKTLLKYCVSHYRLAYIIPMRKFVQFAGYIPCFVYRTYRLMHNRVNLIWQNCLRSNSTAGTLVVILVTRQST